MAHKGIGESLNVVFLLDAYHVYVLGYGATPATNYGICIVA